MLEIPRRMVCPTAEAMSASNTSSDRDVYLSALETIASNETMFQIVIRIPKKNLIIFLLGIGGMCFQGAVSASKTGHF